MSLANLPNLGAKSAEMLARAGIRTEAQLRQLGAVQGFLAVRQAGARPSLNLLWAMEGALTGRKWSALSQQTRNRLLQTLQEMSDDDGND